MSPRLDRALVERGLVRSRNQGREFIRDGQVLVDGEACTRPAQPVESGTRIELLDAANRHRVGRGYDKLLRFLERHPVDFVDRLVVDGGASTGGFTQLALERGAAVVLAVELGRAQLDDALRSDPRVILREGVDLRDVRELARPCERLLLDLSFVSLLDVLPRLALPLAVDARLIALVKPQFEAAASELTAAGRLRRPARAEALLRAVLDCAEGCGWRILGTEAVDPGPDQRNREYFFLADRAREG